jgi:hypothetical protein
MMHGLCTVASMAAAVLLACSSLRTLPALAHHLDNTGIIGSGSIV